MRFLKKPQKGANLVEFPANSVIFSEGDEADLTSVILSGEVELTLSGDLLSNESTGGIIGEMAIIESAQHGATATALSDIKLARFDREQLSAFMIEDAEFTLHVMHVLASRLKLVHEYSTTDFEQRKVG